MANKTMKEQTRVKQRTNLSSKMSIKFQLPNHRLQILRKANPEMFHLLQPEVDQMQRPMYHRYKTIKATMFLFHKFLRSFNVQSLGVPIRNKSIPIWLFWSLRKKKKRKRIMKQRLITKKRRVNDVQLIILNEKVKIVSQNSWYPLS